MIFIFEVFTVFIIIINHLLIFCYAILNNAFQVNVATLNKLINEHKLGELTVSSGTESHSQIAVDKKER